MADDSAGTANIRRSARPVKPTTPAKKNTSTAARPRFAGPNGAIHKAKPSIVVRKRQAAGEVVVLGRRVNLDMDSSATLYKVAREWFYDNPELFAKDDRMAQSRRIHRPKATIPYRKPTSKFLPDDDPPERSVQFTPAAFEAAVTTQPDKAIPVPDLLREHMSHFQQLSDWQAAQHAKSKMAPYRLIIDQAIESQRQLIQQYHAQVAAANAAAAAASAAAAALAAATLPPATYPPPKQRRR